MKRTSSLAAGLALLALTSSVAAQSADESNAKCISEDEISSLVIYALPSLVSAARSSCGATLAPNGFLAIGSDAMVARYAGQKDATWPQARAALFKLASFKDKDEKDDTKQVDNAKQESNPLDDIAGMPDEALRPFVDAYIQQAVAKEIKPKTCAGIERLAEAIAPLEPSETGKLIGTIAGLALADDKDRPVCPVEAS